MSRASRLGDSAREGQRRRHSQPATSPSAAASRCDSRITQDGEQVRTPNDPLVDIGKTGAGPHLPDFPCFLHRQPGLSPADLDAVTVDFVRHWQPRSCIELLALVLADAPFHCGEAVFTHASSVTHERWFAEVLDDKRVSRKPDCELQ
jgi:hypothetical protein